MGNKHTLSHLYQIQSLPLEAKIRLSLARIESLINEFGEDSVYVSFSDGKDSKVLMDIIRNKMNYNVPAVFVDVPTQFPELKEFATSWDNVEVLKPKISFMDVCKKYGFPLISKEVSLKIVRSHKNPENSKYWRFFDGSQKGISIYDCSKNRFMIDAPFNISHQCCQEMKHKPVYEYEKQTNKEPILGTMASESKVRQQKWIQHGCNAFNLGIPVSTPLAFWT